MDVLEGRNIEEDINFFLEQQTSHQTPPFPHFPPQNGNEADIFDSIAHMGQLVPNCRM